MSDSIHFKFTNWNGPGQKLAKPVLPSSAWPGDIAKIENKDLAKKELAENLQKKVAEMKTSFNTLEDAAILDAMLKKSELGGDRKDEGMDRLSEIFEQWGALLVRYEDNGEKTPELLADLEQCQQEFEKLKEDIEIWKAEKKERDAFLESNENKGWEYILKQAKDHILKPNETLKEFESSHSGVNLELDFSFDLSEKIEEYLQQSEEHVDVFGAVEKVQWVKVLAAAKMINDSRSPKTCVILDGVTYMVNSTVIENAVEKDKRKKKEAVEFLNKEIVKSLKEYCDSQGVLDINGKPFVRESVFRDMAFAVGQDFIENEDRLGRLKQCDKKEDMALTAFDEAEIKTLIETIASGDRKLVHELVLKSYVYNRVGAFNSEFKNHNPQGKILNDEEKRALAEDIFATFDPKIKENIDAFLMERAGATPADAKPDLALELNQRIEINEAIKKRVKAEINKKRTPVAFTTPVATLNPAITATTSAASTAPAVPTAPPVIQNVPAVPAIDAAAAQAEKAAKEEKKRLKEEEKKKEQEKIQELYQEVEKETYGVLSIEKFKGLQDGYKKVAEDNGIEKTEATKLIKQQLKADIEFAIETHGKKKGEDLEKVVKYILDQLK